VSIILTLRFFNQTKIAIRKSHSKMLLAVTSFNPHINMLSFLKRKLFACGLLVAVLSPCQATDYPTTTAGCPYVPYYNRFKTGAFWLTIGKIGSLQNGKGNYTTVSNGLGIYDGAGTKGAGMISESTGYALMLAALYNDKTTFDKLSATIQAGLAYGSSKADGKGGYGTKTGLFPWSWKTTDNSTYYAYNDGYKEQYYNPYDSASDADINIALGYIYADKAKVVYGWSDPSTGSTYATMAKNYIAAIRLRDFTHLSSQPLANQYILADGADKAADGFPGYSALWHPDYSDIRAYQLFCLYDTPDFWKSAITYTKAAFKSVLSYGSTDTRSTITSSTAPYNGKSISPSTQNSWLTVNTFANNTFDSDYTKVKGQYNGSDSGSGDTQDYWADASRMPMRLMNYVNASENSDTEIRGIASAMLSALGKTYKDKSYNALTAAIKIYTPFTQQYGGGYMQDYMASGLFALASNSVLTPLQGVCDRATVYSNLNTDFGVDGTSLSNGASGTPLSTFSDKNLAFNASLTLWGLTINKNSANPLQRYMESITTSASAASIATYSIQKSGKVKSVNLSLNQANTGSKLVKVTLTSPAGRSVTVLDRSVNGQLKFSNLLVGGFTNLPAKGTWTITVTGATGARVSSYLNVETY